MSLGTDEHMNDGVMYHSLVWFSVVIVILLQESFIIGSTKWPRGEYALLKPKTGCPSNWKGKSWILQDTKDTKERRNNRSRNLHIDGYVARYYVIRSFCIKTGTVGSSVWPEGQYCIHGAEGFSTGSIKMTGEHHNNKDTVKYFVSIVNLHDENGDEKRHIELHFYCKINGTKKIPISLPITRPFYLLPYGSRDCQQVKWMVATSEWIKYQTENVIKEIVPYKFEDSNGITMFYCYYQSCNHTLNNKKGVFQSPGFPGKYPDGQLCSWRIMVPNNHTLRVRFTNFSLSANDTLRYSKRINNSFEQWRAISLSLLRVPPFTLPFEVLFVFRSDESNNSTGFRAKYRVFIPKAKPKATTTETPKVATATTSVTIPLTTSRKTIIKTSTTSKRQDTRTITETTKSKSTVITKTTVSTKKPQQTKSIHESLTPTNCTAGDSSKNDLTNSHSWNSKLAVIVIPLACSLVIVFLIVDIVYRCRSKRKNSDNRGNEAGSVEQMPLVVNPTYDRGAILLNQPNNTTTLSTMMEVNENGTGMNQPRTDKPPDYEDIESWKPNKIPECNSSNVGGVTQGEPSDTATTEETSKLRENPFYESASTSPPLVEANKLYESIKIDQEKAK